MAGPSIQRLSSVPMAPLTLIGAVPSLASEGGRAWVCPDGRPRRWQRSLRRAGPRAGTLLDPAVRGAVVGFTRAIQANDATTWAHSERVGRRAGAVARELGLRPAAIREVEVAGQLHDIGKIGVPSALLSKPGRLTRAEYRQVMEHVLIGERILKPALGSLAVLMAVVRSHHERFDGCGFPDGLAAHEIPLAVRIVAVADAFDAMTSSRPYREALDPEAALLELWANAGSQFDRVCVDALVDVVDAPREFRIAPTRAATAV